MVSIEGKQEPMVVVEYDGHRAEMPVLAVESIPTACSTITVEVRFSMRAPDGINVIGEICKALMGQKASGSCDSSGGRG